MRARVPRVADVDDEAGIPREKILLAYTGEHLPDIEPHRTS